MRWLRDTNYVKNQIELYTRGGAEALGGITFTHYIHRAILEHAEATGDVSFLVSQLEGMIASYGLFNTTIDNVTGLYHRSPLSDAQEYSLPGYLVGGPGGGPVDEWNDFGLTASQGGGNNYNLIWSGPETYRPSFNAYMVAGARAIAEVASLAGNNDLSETWTKYADGLYSTMQELLYSDELNFWIDRVQGTNLACEGRELIGYFPYRFDVGTSEDMIRGLEAGLTPEHFLTEFGPTTLEQTNPYYTALKNTTYCCMWQGQSWPFSTSVYLGTLARIARDGLSDIITPDFFNQELNKYVLTNYKDGIPYTAESHFPTIDGWSGDTGNHSEHYLRKSSPWDSRLLLTDILADSTYLDNIFTNLFGIVPTFGDTLVLKPLVPSNWSYFAIENLPYHGSLLTFIWDTDGTHYSNNGSYSKGAAGFSIYSNGTLFHHQSTICAVNVTLPFNTTTAAATLASQPEWQNILANPNSPHGLPLVTADACLNLNGDTCDYAPWKMNDGLLWYDTTPDNRWTNNQSLFPYSKINITLPRAREMQSISLAIFDDTARGGVAACPDAVKVTDGAGNVVAYKKPWTECVPNALNTIFFAPTSNGSVNVTTPDNGGYTIETDFLQVLLSDKLLYTTAVTEIQIWVPPATGPRYEAEDGVIGTFIGLYEGRALGMNGTIVGNGVLLGPGGWVELAGILSSTGEAETASLQLIAGGSGVVEVLVNWMTSQNVTLGGRTNGTAVNTIEVPLLRGGNVITVIQLERAPFIDALVVGN